VNGCIEGGKRPGRTVPALAPCATALVTALVLAGCQRAEGDSAHAAVPQGKAETQAIEALPLGDVAGSATESTASLPNPSAHDPNAVQEGHALFIKMNCAGCHGYDAKGGMGPNLTDTYWRYGSVPALIFKSIYEGRPQGMPAWNPALPPSEIWKIVAYIQSLGGTLGPDQYQAWVQGDHPNPKETPPAPATIGGNPQEHAAPKGQGTPPPDTGSRPDAGGTPPGSKP
jgi:cytochrome c oxidase cbb3-type subunit 3